MKKAHAARKYVEIIDRIAPGWDGPQTRDTALPVDWAPNHWANGCSLCKQGFTFLNRRHHCRRCFQLVCAPCSPDRVGVRLSPGTPIRIQRVCKMCVHQMQKQQQFEKDTIIKSGNEASLNPVKIVPPSARERMSKKLAVPRQPISAASSGQETTETIPASSASNEVFYASSPPLGEPMTPQSPKRDLIKKGYLERLDGPTYRKVWNKCYFVVLTRKGTVGIYDDEKDRTPTEVLKLAGFTIRIKSERKRPHQFKIFDADKKSVLRLSATSVQEMNDWVAAFANAVRAANDEAHNTT